MKWIKGIVRFWKTIQIVLLYIIAIFLVYFMFPREGKFKYEYSKSKPWMHETLVAPFDFPISKPEQQVQQERDSLLRNAHLYFFYDSLVGQSRILTFIDDYSDLLRSISAGAEPDQFNILTGHVVSIILEEIYASGILEPHPVLDEQQASKESVMVVRDGLAEEYRLSSL